MLAPTPTARVEDQPRDLPPFPNAGAVADEKSSAHDA